MYDYDLTKLEDKYLEHVIISDIIYHSQRISLCSAVKYDYSSKLEDILAELSHVLCMKRKNNLYFIFEMACSYESINCINLLLTKFHADPSYNNYEFFKYTILYNKVSLFKYFLNEKSVNPLLESPLNSDSAIFVAAYNSRTTMVLNLLNTLSTTDRNYYSMLILQFLLVNYNDISNPTYIIELLFIHQYIDPKCIDFIKYKESKDSISLNIEIGR